MPSQRRARQCANHRNRTSGCQYIRYVHAACEGDLNNKIELQAAREESDETGALTGLEFKDANEEIHAAAAWARRVVEAHQEEAVPDSRPLRIGIVMPNIVEKRTAVEAEFLNAFCPNGYRVWQVPRFSVAEPGPIAETPAGTEALSYLRLRHAARIVPSKVRQSIRSDLFPEEDSNALKDKVQLDREIDSSVDSPLFTVDADRERSLGDWMDRFRALIEKCRSRLDSFGDNYFSELLKDNDIETGRHSLEDLVSMCRKPGTGTLQKDAPGLGKILERFGKEDPAGIVVEPSEEVLLSRLEEAVARSDDRRVLDRLCEIAKGLEECAGAEHVVFNEAYAYFRSACSMESMALASATGPVEILSLHQTYGRHFTHLWISGMRDTEWPPRVRENPLVDLGTLQSQAPEMFDREELGVRGESELRTLIDLCGRRANVRVSYAVRDVRGDREYVRAGSMEEDGDTTGHADPRPESQPPTRIAGERMEWLKEEQQRKDHPHYFEDRAAEPGDDERGVRPRPCVQRREGRDDCVRLPPEQAEALEKARWPNAEFATQFECGFKAFSVHRLGIGAPHVAERLEEVREWLDKLDKLAENPKLTSPEEWKEWEKRLQRYKGPRKIQNGVYVFKRGEKKYIADFMVGLDGGYDTENVKVDYSAEEPKKHSSIKEKSYKDFLNRKKLYPLRVLKCKIDMNLERRPLSRDSAPIPGYVAGEQMDAVKCFDIQGGKAVCWESVGKLIERMQKAYRDGVMRPDPIEHESMAGGRMPGVCADCHLRAACRFHYRGEPVNGGR